MTDLAWASPPIKQLPPFAGCKKRRKPWLSWAEIFIRICKFFAFCQWLMWRHAARARPRLMPPHVDQAMPLHFLFVPTKVIWSLDRVGWEPWAWKILCQFVIPIIARLSIALLLTSEYFNNGEASMKHVVSVSHVVAAYKMTYLPWKRDRGSTEWNNCDKAYP